MKILDKYKKFKKSNFIKNVLAEIIPRRNKISTFTQDKLPLKKVVFCFLDLETTGLHPQHGDQICEIGLLKTKNNKIIDSYESLINPRMPISPGAREVTGITDKMLNSAPVFKNVANKILKFIEGTVIVAHNAPFDLNFFGMHLYNLKILFPENPVIDTLALARAYYQFPSNTLTNIASYFDINTSEAHRALGDTIMTKEIFHRFLDDFKEKKKDITLYDLLELNGGSIVFPTYGEMILPPEIEESLRTNKRLKIRYISAQGDETVRTIRPVSIVPYQDYTYLISHCLLREKRRTFRLDRILEMSIVK